MPFLFPALAAGICDVGILYLGRRNYLLEQEFHSDLEEALNKNQEKFTAAERLHNTTVVYHILMESILTTVHAHFREGQQHKLQPPEL